MEKLQNLTALLPHLSDSLMWAVFSVIVLVMLVLDLLVFHRHAEEPKFSSSLRICLAYMSVALLFGLFVIAERGWETGMLYYTGYLVEFSLSMDNIFVISLVFSSLSVPARFQHRVLFWGILGAIIMRALMIMLGARLVSNFHWVLYVFSVFLIYTGIKMLLMRRRPQNLRDTRLFRWIENHLNITHEIRGEHFIISENGRRLFTPLFFALIVIELMDVIFAIDSIPAIFLITQDPYVVYTSNIFAILGLRSLYFLLAEAVSRFKYLKTALALILIFIGVKIFLPWFGLKISTLTSLLTTFALIGGGIALSLWQSSPKASSD